VSSVPLKPAILRLMKNSDNDAFEKQVGDSLPSVCTHLHYSRVNATSAGNIKCSLILTTNLVWKVHISSIFSFFCLLLQGSSKNDSYCWVCHDGGDVLCCDKCPRVFHLTCCNLDKPPEDEDKEWVCSVCQVLNEPLS